jgi:uncharacterized protein YceK
MRLSVLLLLLLALSGCATTRRESDAEARGYERGYRQAVQEQYWIIQNQQRRPSATTPQKP